MDVTFNDFFKSFTFFYDKNVNNYAFKFLCCMFHHLADFYIVVNKKCRAITPARAPLLVEKVMTCFNLDAIMDAQVLLLVVIMLVVDEDLLAVR